MRDASSRIMQIHRLWIGLAIVASGCGVAKGSDANAKTAEIATATDGRLRATDVLSVGRRTEARALASEILLDQPPVATRPRAVGPGPVRAPGGTVATASVDADYARLLVTTHQEASLLLGAGVP